MIETLGEIPGRAAEEFGDRIALVDGDREFCFRDIDGLSGTLAHNLVQRGVAPGDRVTLYAPNSWECIVSYYGALKAGAIINPINVMLRFQETKKLRYLLGRVLVSRETIDEKIRSTFRFYSRNRR
jgi:long-chain acyl-CoA synthetase